MTRSTLPHLVMKPSLAATFKQLQPGQHLKLVSKLAGAYHSAHATASRLNAASGWREFSVATTDNGTTYTITRRTQEQ